MPETEPVGVDRKTVSRDSPEYKGKIKKSFENASGASAEISGRAKVGPKISGDFSIDATVSGSLSEKTKIDLEQSLRLMLVTQSKTADGEYRWIVTPSLGAFLDGRPWDAETQPRLTLVDQRKDRSAGIPPAVRVEVRCLREDLVIEDLEIKSESRWNEIKSRLGFHNRMAAAESYIRDRLSAEGLEVSEIKDKFGHLTIASVTAESS